MSQQNDVDDLGRVSLDDKRWKIDRNISVGVIVSLVLHTFGLVWFLANLNAGMINLKETNKTMDQRITLINSKLDKMITYDETVRLFNLTNDRIDKLDSRVRDIEIGKTKR